MWSLKGGRSVDLSKELNNHNYMYKKNVWKYWGPPSVSGEVLVKALSIHIDTLTLLNVNFISRIDFRLPREVWTG